MAQYIVTLDKNKINNEYENPQEIIKHELNTFNTLVGTLGKAGYVTDLIESDDNISFRFYRKQSTTETRAKQTLADPKYQSSSAKVIIKAMCKLLNINFQDVEAEAFKTAKGDISDIINSNLDKEIEYQLFILYKDSDYAQVTKGANNLTYDEREMAKQKEKIAKYSPKP